MKYFKVKVAKEKARFFKELLNSLEFVEFKEVKSFEEEPPFIGARSRRGMSSSKAMEEKINSVENRRKSLEDIRKAMEKIDKLRGRS
ncbi:hypothetical protein [Plebeiibacterium marinum]|uniref:Uncharacterized protein n=1 Tax=Plebeiibacterium marinum TaxID=2992111 RepID=A0AAE3MBM9_9BACT|nr:hypothetical protein [Plebeiobacterium marinum]MCW3804918.1 hypothetical protein [Plebeiobacterium marinum]